MLCALASLIACFALIQASPPVRMGLRYGVLFGALMWLVPFGLSALLARR